MTYIREIESFWHKITYESADPLMRDRFWMGSPVPILKYTLFNLMLLWVLRRIMSKRKHGFRLANLTLAVSVYFFLGNCYFFYRCSQAMLKPEFSWRCQSVDRSLTQDNLRLLAATHHIVFFKSTYVLELIIFILRKKEKLVNFYLTVHHLTFHLVIWLVANYHPAGHSTFVAWINSILHILICVSVVLVSLFPKLKGKWFSDLVKYGQVRIQKII